jgi:hypothetical protein
MIMPQNKNAACDDLAGVQTSRVTVDVLLRREPRLNQKAYNVLRSREHWCPNLYPYVETVITESEILYNRFLAASVLWLQIERSRVRFPALPVFLRSGGSETVPLLWFSAQGPWLQIKRSGLQFLALPDIVRSAGSETGSTQPRQDKWGATWKKKEAALV